MDGRSLSGNGCRPGWLRRPDAHDDADANERNMRRHPPLPLSRPSFPPPSPGIDCRRAPRSPERIRRRKGGGRGTNENRTIYPADYSLPPLPSAEIPCRILLCRKRVRRHVSAAKSLRKFAARFPFDFSSRTNAKVYRSRFDPSTLKTLCLVYIYICIHRRLGGGFVDFGRRKKT